MKIVKREAVFIPIKDISVKEKTRIKEDLTFNFFGKEKICEECEWHAERVNDVCESCANFKGQYQLASQVLIGKKKTKYLKIPVGSAGPIVDRLGRYTDVTYIDKSPKTKIAPINFTGTFKPGQGEAVAAMLEKKRGVFKAPPRSGKTVMGTALVCQLRRKTLILASQRDWLMGFQETFVGSDTQKALTNLKKTRIKLCKTLADFQSHDVCLATVQTFYSEGGERLLAKLRDMFSVILVDEVHTAAADKYAKIMSQLNGDWVIGFSGTPQRKDEKEVLVANIIGPIIYEMKTERVRPTVKLTRTGYSKTIKGQVPWVRMVSSLENDKKRIDVIAKQAIRDVKDNHMILLPVAQVKPIKKIVDRINDLAGKKIAYSFTGSLPKAKRDLYIQKAREYKLKILVGTQKILSVGINIPRASMLYECVMSANLPNCTQRLARVCTPHDDKPPPVVRYFLDDFSVRKNCLRQEFWQVMMPVFKPIIDDKTMTMMKAYLSGAKTNTQRFDL